ncbi:MAG TPA: hypothetical protein VLF39_02155 [Candidatus Saccharimonadales bacterium]|nr:hypothetical protein [Candidatus Saccharimonadales bacterium]
MVESVPNRVRRAIGGFQRTVLNQGYIDYLTDREKEEKEYIDGRLAEMAGRLALKRERQPSERSDEEFILAEELFDLERGRIKLDQPEAVSSVTEELPK